MLAFLDESGLPHPNDTSLNPVVVSVCINQEDVRAVASEIYFLKHRMGIPKAELKGERYITRRIFRNRPNQWELVESFFDLCRSLHFTLFAVVMEHPQNVPYGREEESYLPNEYRYMLQSINQLAETRNQMATVLFDGKGPTLYSGMLPSKFDLFLYRSAEGQSFTSICDSPYFVDSALTQGIQIADMVASVCRIYHENKLYEEIPQADSYLSAINRYYGVIKDKTIDFTTPEGSPRFGIYLMPESDHYIKKQ